MSETAARQLYILIENANISFKNLTASQAFGNLELGGDFAEFASRLTALISETRDEILRCDFARDDRADELVSRLHSIQSQILNTVAARGGSATKGPVANDAMVERLLGIVEQVENFANVTNIYATREDMMRETESLISAVKDWELEEYAKRTLLIQLNHISRVIQVADTYTDAELRIRVKAIIADFAAEFVDMDKRHRGQLERLVFWGRRGFFAGTIFLGLTADVTSITAALPPP